MLEAVISDLVDHLLCNLPKGTTLVHRSQVQPAADGQGMGVTHRHLTSVDLFNPEAPARVHEQETVVYLALFATVEGTKWIGRCGECGTWLISEGD